MSAPMAEPQPRILVIEDDLDTADLVLETIRDYFGPGRATHVGCAAEVRGIDPTRFDLVLSDMNLPDGNGLEIMRDLLGRRPDLPIVFVTGESILGHAIEAIRGGAYDYVVKAGDYLFSIPVVIEKNLELWRIKRDNERLQRQLAEKMDELNLKNEQLNRAVDRLETMAATDPLTGLANRRSINGTLAGRFAEARRGGSDLAVLMMDLDGFKQLNDAAGHPAGDRILVAAARVIEANCRMSDLAGRFGGDEFVLVLPNSGREKAEKVADRIRTDFAHAAKAECDRDGYDGQVTMSMGLATMRTVPVQSVDQLLVNADHALYAAKAAGKRQLMVYDTAITTLSGKTGTYSI